MRDIDKIFVYIMITFSYTVSLLMKIGLFDVSYIIHYKNQYFQPDYVAIVRFVLGILMIFQATLAFLVRDSLLVANNYHLNKDLKKIELIDKIYSQVLDKDAQTSIFSTIICDKCHDSANLDAKDIPFELEICNYCKKSKIETSIINVRDSWLMKE